MMSGYQNIQSYVEETTTKCQHCQSVNRQFAGQKQTRITKYCSIQDEGTNNYKHTE